MRIFSKEFLQKLLPQVAILASALIPTLMHASGAVNSIELPSTEMHVQKKHSSDSDKLPIFTPFNWADQPSYAIQGTLYSYVSGVGNVGSNPVTYVIDPANQRILYDLTPHGKYYIFEDESFITGVFPTCTRVLKADGSNFTFADQVEGYLNVLSTIHSTTKKPKYFGRAADVGSCQDRIAIEIHLKNGFMTQFNYSQMVPVEGLGCAYITGFTKFKLDTVDSSNLDHYFVLPTDCTDSAPSYCSEFYYDGNPCGNCE